MPHGNNTLGRVKHFGRYTTYNPFRNSQELKTLSNQIFFIPENKPFFNCSSVLISTGLITNEIAFINNFSAEVLNIDGTLLKNLSPKLLDIGSEKEPSENEIVWFDIEGGQGDYWIHETYCKKVLRINGKFEATAIVADEMNHLTGCTMAWSGSLDSIPNRSLVCQGQAISRNLYPVLFSIVGTRYGSGDGYSTFNLPDPRDGVIKGVNGERDIGVGQSVLNDPDNFSRFAGKTGGTSGTNVGSYQRFATEPDTREHNHTTINYLTNFSWSGGKAADNGKAWKPNDYSLSKGSGTNVTSVQYGTGKSTRDNNLYVHYIIFI